MNKSINAPSIGNSCRKALNVEQAVSQLDEASHDMEEVVQQLADVLQPLLGSERPCGLGEDRCRGESEVAERILSRADQLRHNSARIRDLIDRL